MGDEWDDYRRARVRMWLHDVRACVSRMRSIEAQIREEHDAYDMMRSSSVSEHVSGGGMQHGDDAIAERIIRIQELCVALGEQNAEYTDKTDEARTVFSRLSSHPVAGEMMTYHWLLGWTWERVAEATAYSVQRVKQVADDATLECYGIMPAVWRDRIPRADD